MSDASERTREIVEGLSVPARPIGFAERVRDGAIAAERRLLRRWKRTSYVLAPLAAGALVAAGVLIAAPTAARSVVDVTVSCPSELKGDRPVWDVGAAPTGPPQLENGVPVKPPPGFHPPVSMQVATADHVTVMTFSSGAAGYQLDRRRCTPWKQKPALGSHGLALAGTYTFGEHLNFGSRCVVSRVVMRARIETDDTGVPVRARVLVLRAKTSKPLMYVDWTQQQVRGWAARTCEKWPWMGP
jgi:hypothetical protein